MALREPASGEPGPGRSLWPPEALPRGIVQVTTDFQPRDSTYPRFSLLSRKRSVVQGGRDQGIVDGNPFELLQIQRAADSPAGDELRPGERGVAGGGARQTPAVVTPRRTPTLLEVEEDEGAYPRARMSRAVSKRDEGHAADRAVSSRQPRVSRAERHAVSAPIFATISP